MYAVTRSGWSFWLSDDETGELRPCGTGQEEVGGTLPFWQHCGPIMQLVPDRVWHSPPGEPQCHRQERLDAWRFEQTPSVWDRLLAEP